MRFLRLVSDHKWYRRMMQQVVGHPSQQPFSQAGMAIASHNNEIGFPPPGLGDESGSNIATDALNAMQNGIDPVMFESRPPRRQLLASERHSKSREHRGNVI